MKLVVNRHILFIIIMTLAIVNHSMGQGNVTLSIQDNVEGKLKTSLNFIIESKLFEPLVEKPSKLSASLNAVGNLNITGLKKVTVVTCALSNQLPFQVLMSPGDSLGLVISSNGDSKNRLSFTFTGKNAIRYNFKSLRDSLLMTKKLKNVNSAEALFKAVDSIDAKNNKLIDTYFEIEKDQFLYDYLYAINKARAFVVIYNEAKNNRISFEPKDFNIINKYFPKTEKHLEELLVTTNDYVYSMKLASQILSDRKPNENTLLRKTKVIDSAFRSPLKNILLANSYYKYSNSSSSNEKGIEIGNNWYRKYKDKLGDSSYNNFIDQGYYIANLINKNLPDSILNLSFFSSENKPIKLREILSKYNNSAIVLDHWATWCGPCIFEFKAGNENVRQAQVKGVKFIYISLDLDSKVSQMNKLIKEYDLDSYRLDKKSTSAYSKYFNIGEIPRYISLNSLGEVKNINLPRPSSREFPQAMKTLSSETK
ncbi:thioredoxin-like domain-containing protein [Pedobacter sp. Leaf194]|uniref:TlpA family protein disulfide reductase n=1 Tax=Pedobacter sp. Leaf194 TaxID=1736297 RepID=UPI0007028345|nr:thioredoxin-like domain-containing protein [Pedobacter sp. Leaf194]KQS36814.1 hypothetical protein ASG14_07190 [Pedobacter sp. Leaf194]